MKNRREDTGCCSRMFLKSMMVVFNTFFWISGFFFLFVGVASFFLRHDYITLLPGDLFAILTYSFIGIGGLIVIVGGVGCLATMREIRGCLIFYAFILICVFMAETCAGVVSYMYESAIHEELSRNLNKTLTTKYSVDIGVTVAVDTMQENFQCCGAVSYMDWQHSVWAATKSSMDANLVPVSCCLSPNTTCASVLDPTLIFTQGCIKPLEEYFRLHLILVGGIGLGLSILQVFGLLFSCCLASKTKEEDVWIMCDTRFVCHWTVWIPFVLVESGINDFTKKYDIFGMFGGWYLHNWIVLDTIFTYGEWISVFDPYSRWCFGIKLNISRLHETFKNIWLRRCQWETFLLQLAFVK